MLAISGVVSFTGGDVKSARVAVNLSAAGEGATADTTFSCRRLSLMQAIP
jgi:hypothetical protein